MTISDFKIVAVTKQFNTNNGWGFGGKSGKEYTLKNCSMQVGSWSYRRAPNERFNLFYIDEKTVTRQEFESKISTL